VEVGWEVRGAVESVAVVLVEATSLASSLVPSSSTVEGSSKPKEAQERAQAMRTPVEAVEVEVA
jgi:hypothetical protein